MAVAVLVEIPAGTAEQYERVAAQAFPDGRLPGDALLHLAGPADDGWRVINVWESREAFERFARERIIPAARAAGEAEPRFSFFGVHTLLQRS